MFTPPGLYDTIQMPGNRGGLGIGALLPPIRPDGTVYVSQHRCAVHSSSLSRRARQPWFWISPRGRFRREVSFISATARPVTVQTRKAGMGPTLVDITKRLDPAVIRSTILNGRGEMPAISNLDDQNLGNLIAFLDDPKHGGAAKFDFSKLMPAASKTAGGDAGPVVASGGAPAGKLDPGMKIPGFQSLRNDGRARLSQRTSRPIRTLTTRAGNVMYKYASPPWSSLTAYDSQQWNYQVANSDWRRSGGAERRRQKIPARSSSSVE